MTIALPLTLDGTNGNDIINQNYIDPITGIDYSELYYNQNTYWNCVGFIYAGDGNDIINLLGNSNNLDIRAQAYGGNGNDTIHVGVFAWDTYGDSGDDIIYVVDDIVDPDFGVTTDAIRAVYGGRGNDQLFGGDGGGTMLFGGKGNDLVYGGNGNDTIEGNCGVDILYGGGGNDDITASTMPTTVYGGAGDDVIATAMLRNYLYTITGGDGSDRFEFTSRTFTARATGMITDYNAAEDHLIINDVEYHVGTAMVGVSHHDTAAGVVIDFGTNDQIILSGYHHA